ncbi:PEP-CTERM sorting domain-containing protein [Rubritalea tangerina]|uniref:PEP-CTERM sorting domain-containing protein n=1 Tax=Rubritalea tangerina TaxID=430798 RepID=A0ABW4ZFX3_9BACT
MKTSTLSIYTLLGFASSSAIAASVAINFSENTNQNFNQNSPIGPTGINSANWNNTTNRDSGSLAAGSITNLIDDSGASTGTSLTWSSNNVYYNREDGVGSDQAKLAVGYLDDTASAISISLTSVTYAQYRVYILLSSDQGQTGATTYTTTSDILINGQNPLGQIINGSNTGANATAYGSIIDANAGAGNNWVQILGDGAGSQTQTGNYFTFETSGDLTITSGRTGGRGSIAGVIVEAVPEPSSTALIGLAGLALIIRRRK